MGALRRFVVTVTALTILGGQANKYLQRRKRKKPVQYEVLKAPSSEREGKRRTVAVLGGTGYVGSNVVKELVASGEYCVYVLGRTFRGGGDAATKVDARIRVDFSDREGLCRALAGVDSVIHTAALLPNAFTSPRDLLTVNEDAARNVVSAAQETGVRHLVYVTGVDTRYRAQNAVARAMFQSFRLAGDAIVSANGSRGLRTTCLCYGAMYGLGDPLWEGVIEGTVQEIPDTASAGTVTPINYVAKSIVKAEQKLEEGDATVAGRVLKIVPLERMMFRDFIQLPQWGNKVKLTHSLTPKVKAYLNVAAIAILGWAPFGAGSCPVMHCATEEEVVTDTSYQEALGIPPIPTAREGVEQLVREFKAKKMNEP